MSSEITEPVFIIGNTSSEFAAVLSLLAEQILQTNSQIYQLPEVCRNENCRKNSSQKKQLTEITARFFILLQSYPSQFSTADIIALKGNNPFSPILLIAGCCCEGANRTAPVLSGVFRFYPFQIDGQIAAEVSSFLTGKNSLFSLPCPVSNEEIILYLMNKTGAGGKDGSPANSAALHLPLADKQCCIIDRFGPLGNDSAMNELLADIYRRRGFSVSFDLMSLPENYKGKIIADADDSAFPQILESFQRIRDDFADSDITGYINSPRINEKTALCNAGVNLVLHKL